MQWREKKIKTGSENFNKMTSDEVDSNQYACDRAIPMDSTHVYG